MTEESTHHRRTGKHTPQVGDYFNAPHRYYNQNEELMVTNVRSGEYYVAEGPKELMVTVLGSCIATCIFDPISKIAGMNHFLIPGDFNTPPSPRYGIFAMEYMINEILKRGGVKTRLIVKVFGGGNVMKNTTMQIGQKNIEFITEYLANESLTIAASDVGDDCPRRVHFYADTGKVRVRRLRREDDIENTDKEESAYAKEINGVKHPSYGVVELFKK